MDLNFSMVARPIRRLVTTAPEQPGSPATKGAATAVFRRRPKSLRAYRWHEAAALFSADNRQDSHPVGPAGADGAPDDDVGRTSVRRRGGDHHASGLNPWVIDWLTRRGRGRAPSSLAIIVALSETVDTVKDATGHDIALRRGIRRVACSAIRPRHTGVRRTSPAWSRSARR